MNQPLALRRRDDGASEPSAARLAYQRDTVRVATKRSDVALHPAQHGDQIHQTVVARRVSLRFFGQLRMREKAERPEAVVIGDHDRALSSQRFAIESRSRADGQRATMRPHDHRPPFRSRRRPRSTR